MLHAFYSALFFFVLLLAEYRSALFLTWIPDISSFHQNMLVWNLNF